MSVLECANSDTWDILDPAAMRSTAVDSDSVTNMPLRTSNVLILAITLSLRQSGCEIRRKKV